MKKLLLIIGLLFLTFTLSASSFCDGFSDGYKEGACFEKIGCVPPVPPVCPVPRVGEKQDSYRDGYNRGFATAISKNND